MNGPDGSQATTDAGSQRSQMVDVSAPVPHPTSSQLAEGFGAAIDKYSRKWPAPTAHVRLIRVAGHPPVTRRIRHVDSCGPPNAPVQRRGPRSGRDVWALFAAPSPAASRVGSRIEMV